MPRPTVPSVESLRPTGPLAFLQPDDEPSPLPSPSDLPEAMTESMSPSDLQDPWPSSDLPSSDQLEDTEPGRRSSTGSRGGSTLKVTRDAARKGVRMAGGIAHKYLTRDEVDRFVNLYLTDEDDEEAIGDPLAKIVRRHGALGQAANPDVIDGLNALFGLVVYGFKQLDRAREAVRIRREMRSQQPPADEAGDDAEG